MTAIVPEPTPKSLLPVRSAHDGPLFFVITIIIFLACVSALITRAAFVSSANWRADLNGAMTIQIKDATEQSAKASRAAKLLRALPGIRQVHIYDRNYSEALLEPWLGKGNIPPDLPLPVLMAIQLNPTAPASKVDILTLIRNNGINAAVDDHHQWATELNHAARFLQIFSLAALSLLASAAIAITSFATKANLAARRDVVNTLHLAGAFDGFIAEQFERRFGGLGLRAGMMGAALAGLTIGSAQLLASTGSGLLLPVFRLDLVGFGLLVLAPVLTAFASALTARMAVLFNLREQE